MHEGHPLAKTLEPAPGEIESPWITIDANNPPGRGREPENGGCVPSEPDRSIAIDSARGRREKFHRFI